MARRRVAAAVDASVRIRRGTDDRRRGLALAAKGAVVELVRREPERRARMAVVRVVDDDAPLVAGRGARQPQREVVGLAAGIDEEDDAVGCEAEIIVLVEEGAWW